MKKHITPSINVFIHRGIIGLEGENVSMKGQGIIEPITKDNFKISQEAYDALLTVPIGNRQSEEINCFKTESKLIFGWLGPNYKAFRPDKIVASKDTDFSLLQNLICQIETPEDFKIEVDKFLQI